VLISGKRCIWSVWVTAISVLNIVAILCDKTWFAFLKNIVIWSETKCLKDGVSERKAPISRALLTFYERMSDPKDRSFFRSSYDPSLLFHALCQRSVACSQSFSHLQLLIHTFHSWASERSVWFRPIFYKVSPTPTCLLGDHSVKKAGSSEEPNWPSFHSRNVYLVAWVSGTSFTKVFTPWYCCVVRRNSNAPDDLSVYPTADCNSALAVFTERCTHLFIYILRWNILFRTQNWTFIIALKYLNIYQIHQGHQCRRCQWLELVE